MVVPAYASYHCFLRELSETLVQRGWEVLVACDLSADMGQERDPGRENGIVFIDFRFPRGWEPLGYVNSARALRRCIRELRPTLIHAHFSAAILATALAIRSSDPFTAIGTFQGLQFPLADGFKQKLYRWAESFAAGRLQGAWVLTEDDLSALKRAGVKQTRIQKGFGFGCRIDRFDPAHFSDETRRSFREKWGIAAGETVFAFVGRNVDFKGFALVVNAFCRLFEGRKDVRLLIVGDRDPLHPTGLSDEEETRMAGNPGIICCGWQRDVAPFLAMTDALVHPSSREGMPVGCMEAIAMGVQIIGADSRGMRELLALTGQDPLPEVSERAIAAAMAQVAERKRREGTVGMAEAVKIRPRLDRFVYVEEQIGIYSEWVKE
jgi:glycosyltransferase involved in cell wall biosynthesis